MVENGCQQPPKIDANIFLNWFQKGAETKITKNVKNDNPTTFQLEFWCAGGGGRGEGKSNNELIKGAAENDSKIKCDFKVEFYRIWEPCWDRKSFQNRRKRYRKQNDFETKLACWTPTSGPRSLLRHPPWRPPGCVRSLPQNIGVSAKSEEEGRKDERKKGTIEDLTRQGHKAWRILIVFGFLKSRLHPKRQSWSWKTWFIIYHLIENSLPFLARFEVSASIGVSSLVWVVFFRLGHGGLPTTFRSCPIELPSPTNFGSCSHRIDVFVLLLDHFSDYASVVMLLLVAPLWS